MGTLNPILINQIKAIDLEKVELFTFKNECSSLLYLTNRVK